MPKTMTVLGAGVVGIEYASIFAALGIAVTLVDTRDRLLPYFDREIVATLVRELGELGVQVHHDDRYARITRLAGTPPRVACETAAGKRLRVRRAALLRRARREHQRHRPRHARHHARQVRPARGERPLPDRASPHLRGRRRDRLPGARQHGDGAGPPGDAPRAGHPGSEGAHRGAAVRRVLDPRGRLRRRHRGGAGREARSTTSRAAATTPRTRAARSSATRTGC